MKTKMIVSAVLTVSLLIGGVLIFTGQDETVAAASAVPADGQQVVEVSAQGGYFPRRIVAQANVPTILRMRTQGTYDCSSTLNIPAIGYSAELPPTGTTEIEIPAQQAGSEIQGICSMGMYSFQIAYQ